MMKIAKYVMPFALIVLVASVGQRADAQRQEATVLGTYAPSPSLAKDSRVFELRTYYAHPGKLEEIHKRFREATLRYYRKSGADILYCWGPTDKEQGSDERLMCLLAYKNREAREAARKKFESDPEWREVIKKYNAAGPTTAKSESILMMATDYSPAK